MNEIEDVLDRVFGVPDKSESTKKTLQKERLETAAETDQWGHYDIDGVSFDGDEITVSSDGRSQPPIKVNSSEDFSDTEERWSFHWSWNH